MNPRYIKAWHLHKSMILNYCVPYGKATIVMYDDRSWSPTYKAFQETTIGKDNYCLINIPPGIWSGFYSSIDDIAIIANCASIPHDPSEILRLPANDPYIPFTWPFPIL